MDLQLGDEFLSRQRALVIAPHSDDETYGCAGTIARIKSLGGEVFALLVTVGSLTHYGSNADPDMHLVTAETRLREFQSTAELLKIDDWEVLYASGAEHLALDTVPRKDIVARLERDARLSIEQVQPTMLLMPWTSYNQDHDAVFRACLTATRPGDPAARHLVPHVLCYDNSSLFWAAPGERFQPNVLIDISDFLGVKLEALRMHASQRRGPLFHGSPEAVELQSRLRGKEISVDSAEGFMALRMAF
ncbi:MAG TPA: PIG-L deacetylase family protein [Pseudonocardiaceae bacterium]|jgi:LmbE family N-acetylglucosaminyl deacetylase|nr:PIG-L deacetylase family protein [Pseudonocardiaceae bacterium]